jgi:hypothetical protein
MSNRYGEQMCQQSNTLPSLFSLLLVIFQNALALSPSKVSTQIKVVLGLQTITKRTKTEKKLFSTILVTTNEKLVLYYPKECIFPSILMWCIIEIGLKKKGKTFPKDFFMIN